MTLESFVFATKYCTRVNMSEMPIARLHYIAGRLSRDGVIGETGWHVSVSAAKGFWLFDVKLNDAPMLRAFLAGTEAAAVTLWPQACKEAAARNQLPRGAARKKLKAPWVAAVTLDGLQTASNQIVEEVAGLETEVACALLEGWVR